MLVLLQGFEDILILDDILADLDTEGVEKCLKKFTATRSADAQAICDLAMYNYEEMRHLVNQKGYYLRRLIDMNLHRILGDMWVPHYAHVTFSQTPYSQCISHKAWQDEVSLSNSTTEG
jgi:kynurenine 3-monooxygenase